MCDYDAPICFSQKDRVARKEHRCCECGIAILPGQTYQYSSGIWKDTGPMDYKTCEGCVILRNHVFAETDDDCYPFFTGLLEAARESDYEAGCYREGGR